MLIINHGPQSWAGTPEVNEDGTQDTQPILIPVEIPVNVSKELGSRLISDFQNSPFFKFEVIENEDSYQQELDSSGPMQLGLEENKGAKRPRKRG